MLAGVGTVARGVRSSGSALGAAVRSVSAGVTFDRRRMEARSGWALPDEEDPDFFVLGKQRLGEDYQLNWTINKYQITPRADAYRNLHTRGLQMLSKSTADKQKRVCVEVSAPASHETLYVEPSAPAEGAAAVAVPAGAKVISQEQFRFIFRDVRKYLSTIGEVFVHDGAVGSSAAAEVKARCFLDNAVHTLYLNHMMTKVPVRAPLTYAEQMQLYVAGGLALDQQHGVPANCTIVDLENNRAVVCGNAASAPVREGLISVAAPILDKESGALAVAGHTVLVGDKSALVFADAHTAAPAGVEQYSAAHSIWGDNGLSRAWNGITCPPSANAGGRGDLLEVQGGSKLLTSALPNARGSVVAHPTAAVFVSTKGKGVTALDAKKAAEQFKASGQVQGTSAETFVNLLEKNKVKAFSVGPADAAKGIASALGAK